MLGRAVERIFNAGYERLIGRGIRTPASRWWHRAGVQLRDHFLPDRGVPTDRIDVQILEHEVGNLQSLVVAADAVGVYGRLDRDRGLCGGGLGRLTTSTSRRH